MAKIESIDLPKLDKASEADILKAMIAIRAVIDIGNDNTKHQCRQWLKSAADSDVPLRLQVKLGVLLNKLGDTRHGVSIITV